MQAVGQLACHAQRHGVAGAAGTADFNQAGGGQFRDEEGQAGWPAHQYMGGLAVDQHGGRTEAVRAEIGADEFDFAQGERGGGHDDVDAGIGRSFRGGLGAGAGHMYLRFRNAAKRATR